MIVRRAHLNDLPRILELNNRESKRVGNKDINFFQKYMDISFFNVAEYNGTIDQNTEYDSINFLWFKERYDKFFYIDRVIVDESIRGKGIGSLLYRELMDKRENIPLVAEVSIEPSNEGSVIFHDKIGFREVGTLKSGNKKVRMYYLK